jgi:hypothetical protein
MRVTAQEEKKLTHKFLIALPNGLYQQLCHADAGRNCARQGAFQPGKELIRCRHIARITLHVVYENTCIDSDAAMPPEEISKLL